MRLFLVFLLFIQTTSVFAQNNDSSVIVKGHLRAILKKAQEEDKMILLFPVKRFTVHMNDYPTREVYLSKNGASSISNQNDILDIDGWLSTLKTIYTNNYIIAPVDISYGEGELFKSELTNVLYAWSGDFARQEDIKSCVYLLNKEGDLLEHLTFYNGELLKWGYEKIKPTTLQVEMKKFWAELPDFDFLVTKRTLLWKKYKENKENETIVRELYKLNLYLGVQDCEVKDAYFLIRQRETPIGYFEEEAEFLKYSCKENSKARDFFLKYGVSRSKYSYIWIQQVYDEAVRTKSDTVFKVFLENKDTNSCRCYCYESEFEAVKFANDIQDKNKLKSSAERFMKMEFFDLKSSCWKEIGKTKAQNRIPYLTNEVAKFYYQNFITNEELQTALFWVNSALEINNTVELLYSKAKLLFRLGKRDEAKQIITENLKKSKRIDVDRIISINFTQALKEIEEGTF